MAQKMLKFVTVEQRMPTKRNANERAADFKEIYDRFTTSQAAEQAARCSQCGVPYCQIHCPLSNNIPDWLKLTAEGRLEEAYELASATNTLPEVCGRICPQDRLCEGNCVIERNFDSVTIGAVERYITDTAWDQGWIKPFTPKHELSASSAPAPAAWPPPNACAGVAMRSMSMTATTGSAACWFTAFPVSSWKRTWCSVALGSTSTAA